MVVVVVKGKMCPVMGVGLGVAGHLPGGRRRPGEKPAMPCSVLEARGAWPGPGEMRLDWAVFLKKKKIWRISHSVALAWTRRMGGGVCVGDVSGLLTLAAARARASQGSGPAGPLPDCPWGGGGCDIFWFIYRFCY